MPKPAVATGDCARHGYQAQRLSRQHKGRLFGIRAEAQCLESKGAQRRTEHLTNLLWRCGDTHAIDQIVFAVFAVG